jgi:hypothetical protein
MCIIVSDFTAHCSTPFGKANLDLGVPGVVGSIYSRKQITGN